MSTEELELNKNKLFKKICWQSIVIAGTILGFFIYYFIKEEIRESDEKYAIGRIISFSSGAKEFNFVEYYFITGDNDTIYDGEKFDNMDIGKSKINSVFFSEIL